MVNTIPPVGVELEQVKLKDFVVIPPAKGLQDDASVYLTTYTSRGKLDKAYVYLDENICADFEAEEPGWYDADSVADYDPVSADEEVIEFGRGMIVKSNCGASIRFSGEVQKKGPTFVIAKTADGGFTYIGNSTPSNHQLKDFAIISPAKGLQDDASVYMTTYTTRGKLDKAYVYLDETICEDFEAEEPGWYDADSVADYDPIDVGDDVIDAGRMFIIKSNCGAEIVMPDGY